jgi:hypothetical protein
MADFIPANTDIVSPKEFVIEDVELYTEHMDYYFDVQVNETAKNFTNEERDEMFQMFHDHSNIIKKMFHAKIPLVEHVLGNPWPPEEIINDPRHEHLQIRDYNHWMIDTYEEWKKSKNL